MKKIIFYLITLFSLFAGCNPALAQSPTSPVRQTTWQSWLDASGHYWFWNGTSWYPSAATGSVISVGTGYGLLGGPITTTGTLKADTSLLLPKLNLYPLGDTRWLKISAPSFGGTVANITATSNSTLTTLSALSLPYSQLTGTPSLSGYQTLANLETTLTNSTTLYPSGSAVTAAIGSYVPYTGATGPVNLGSNTITTGGGTLAGNVSIGTIASTILLPGFASDDKTPLVVDGSGYLRLTRFLDLDSLQLNNNPTTNADAVNFGYLKSNYLPIMGGTSGASILYTYTDGIRLGENLYIGKGAGNTTNIGHITTPFEQDNIGVGDSTLTNAVNLYATTAVGWDAGHSYRTTYSNSLLGYRADELDTSGHGNSLIGTYILGYNKNAAQMSGVGWHWGLNHTTGSQWAGVGDSFFFNNIDGIGNSGVGSGVGGANIHGSYDLYLGYEAAANDTGSYHLFIETNTGYANNPLIGGDFSGRTLQFNGTISSVLNVSGATTLTNTFTNTASLKSSAGLARAQYIAPTLTPIANNDKLVGADYYLTAPAGTGALTATASGTTSASDGTYTAQATTTVTGSGSGATYTVVTSGNVATSQVPVVNGTGYAIGNTFTIAALPGITFTVASLGYTGVIPLSARFNNYPIQVPAVSADPTTLTNGEIWYNFTSNAFNFRANSTTYAINALPTSVVTSGTWAAARMPAFTGDVTNTAGSLATTISANAVTYAKMQTQATNTVLGNISGSTGVPTALTATQLSTIIATAIPQLITGTPTIVAGTGAGTSPTVGVTTNGKQLQVTVTVGTLPTASATIATVTLPHALSYTPYPVFSSPSGAGMLLSGTSMIAVSSTGSSNVTLTAGTVALPAGTYVWNIAL